MSRETGRCCAGSRRRVGADDARRSTRRKLLVAVASALAAPSSFAQQPAKSARIGFLGATTPVAFAKRLEAFRAGLRERGYVEGRNLTIESRWAEGNYERLPQLAAELAQLNVDVIVTHGTPGTTAAKKATATIPIVISIAGDAVATGLVASLARPGGNITGATFFTPELHAKRLELLKEAVPQMTRAAFLLNPGNPASATEAAQLTQAAQTLKLQLQHYGVRASAELEVAFAAMA